MTPAEQALWARLRDGRLLGFHFRRQQPIDRFVADFYCDALKLVIELDGPIHEEQREADAARDAVMQTMGLTVWRVPNEAVLPHPARFLRNLRLWIASHPPEKTNRPP